MRRRAACERTRGTARCGEDVVYAESLRHCYPASPPPHMPTVLVCNNSVTSSGWDRAGGGDNRAWAMVSPTTPPLSYSTMLGTPETHAGGEMCCHPKSHTRGWPMCRNLPSGALAQSNTGCWSCVGPFCAHAASSRAMSWSATLVSMPPLKPRREGLRRRSVRAQMALPGSSRDMGSCCQSLYRMRAIMERMSRTRCWRARKMLARGQCSYE
mmetsp:Transcript_4011/g.12828  ORF Transcript_4011/g.12828 Transcript_4011/m.12828 type:complete len:212 (-) Transcript_4011:1360-1995(-)